MKAKKTFPLLSTRSLTLSFTLLFLFFSLFLDAGAPASDAPFPRPLTEYGDSSLTSITEIIRHRIHLEPFNLIATIIFAFAILHTFFANKFKKLSKILEKNHNEKLSKENLYCKLDDTYQYEVDESVSFPAEMAYFLGEVEVVFGLWVIPLIVSMMFFYGWDTAMTYINTRNYTEPMFLIVVMTLSATRPILRFAEKNLMIIANLFGKGSPAAVWLSILTLAPLFGSLITEPGAMTIGALLLGEQFYAYKPKKVFAYATLGLLFVNTSVGGVLTHFAAPPVLMVARTWEWGSYFMLTHFGWKAILAILTSNFIYFVIFRKQFRDIKATKDALENEARIKNQNKKVLIERPIPIWVIFMHIVFLTWIVINNHNPAIFIGTFLLFLGFHQATAPHQKKVNLRPATLVGFFIAGLVIHGGLQGWWIQPILLNLGKIPLMISATVLTAFNDNAVITYLTTLVPNFADELKYVVVAGAVTGGGLTVIANAPNPAGQLLLQRYFNGGISPFGLFCGALFPTIVVFLYFLLLP